MASVVIGYANRFAMKLMGYILDEGNLRELRTKIWVYVRACCFGGKNRFCCKVSIMN